MERIRIIESKNYVDQQVEVAGWIANKRSSGKIAFLELRDGSAYFQHKKHLLLLQERFKKIHVQTSVMRFMLKESKLLVNQLITQ